MSKARSPCTVYSTTIGITGSSMLSDSVLQVFVFAPEDALALVSGRSGPRLGVADALSNCLEERPRHLGMTLDEGAEAPDRELVAVHIRVRPDRRGSCGLVDQGHLAERVARTETTDLLAVHRHGHLTALDDDERPAAVALFGDRLAGAEGALHELASKPLEEAVVGPGEERDSADQIQARLRHRRILRLTSGHSVGRRLRAGPSGSVPERRTSAPERSITLTVRSPDGKAQLGHISQQRSPHVRRMDVWRRICVPLPARRGLDSSRGDRDLPNNCATLRSA